MLLALGVLAALVERERSGLGQVVDAAMVDGSALLTSFLYGLRAAGAWRDERGTNLLDGGAPFYDTYRDGRRRLRGRRARWSRSSTPNCWPASGWPAPACPRSTTGPAGRCCGTGSPRCSRAEPGTSGRRRSPGSDACVAPVLSAAEAPRTRTTLPAARSPSIGGVGAARARAAVRPRSAAGRRQPPPGRARDTDAVLAALGRTPEEIAALRARGAVG